MIYSNNSSCKYIRLVCCIAIPCVVSGEMSAREASVNRLEEIIVTAQKREQRISEVPIAIAAYTGEHLNNLKITDTRDLELMVPGFKVADSGFNTPIYTLRGVGFNDTSYTAQSTVGVYIDEISLPYAIMTKGPILDLERVEVLKGPQGTLYGRNTTGGAINYVAAKPSEEFEGGIRIDYSRFQTTDVEGYISGAISEKVTARLAIRDIRSKNGNQDSLTRPDSQLGEKDKQSYRALIEWQADQSLFFRLGLEGWRDSSEPRAGQAIACLPQVAGVAVFRREL